MADLLNIGSSALLSYQQSLNVISSNISNANTAGYSRQSATLTQNVNGGVNVTSVARLTDALLYNKSLGDTAAASRTSTFQAYASNIDGLLSQSASGLQQPLQQFFSAVSAVTTNPQDTAARQNLLSAAGNLTASFNNLQSQIDGLQSNINTQLGQSVSQINSAAANIAQLNNAIALAQGSGQQPNALLDQRDQLITQLSQQLGVSTVKQTDGSINVFTANGQPLVVGATASTLSLVSNTYDPTRMEVAIGQPPININSQLSGGIVGGLLNARSQLLDPTAASLGKIATALAQAVNTQNAQGVDLNGYLGTAVFAAPTPTVFAASTNQGAASVSAAVVDPSQLSGGNYTLRYDGSAWSLIQTATGTAVPMSGAGTAASPFTAAGLSFQVSGAASAGDSYLIEPTQHAAGQIGLVMSDPAQIAAAAAVTPKAATSNTGTGTIALNAISNGADPNLFTPVTIQFTSANTYSINGAGSYAYTPGAAISMNGWSVAISGAPASGDTFSVGKTPPNSGDNSNANLLANIATKGLLDGGSNSVKTANVALVSKAGTTAQQATASASAAQSILTQTQSQLSSTAGVNLDQEAADLLRFQQAYQAAAQVISTGQNLFQSLLSAVRGG